MKKIEVYRNLKKDCLSIRRAHGRVIYHSNYALVGSPSFVVQKAGYERTVKTGQRNVHAFVRGELLGIPNSVDIINDIAKVEGYKEIAMAGRSMATYNPFKGLPFFVDIETGLPLRKASFAIICATGEIHYV